MLLGTDDYPKSQEAVLNMLNHYVSETITQNNLRPAPQEGVAFIQKNGEGKAPRVGPQVNEDGRLDCFHCGEEGHWEHMCPKLSKKEKTEMKWAYNAKKREQSIQLCQVGFEMSAEDLHPQDCRQSARHITHRIDVDRT